MFLFPYETIKKDSNIIIYGAGTMGTDYILQVQKTGYCNILFALDRVAKEKVGFPVGVYTPDYINKIDATQYDYVLVALQDVNHSENIKEILLSYGVQKEKIVQAYEVGLNCAGFFQKPQYINSSDNIESLYLAFYAYGGMGDTLITTALIKAIKKLVQFPLKIDYYCNCPEVYKNFPFIDNVFKLTQFSDCYDYDCSIFVFRNINFKKINLEKIKRISKTLYEWCIDVLQINEKICDNFRDDCRYSIYTARKGKNRIEQHNIHGILPYDRYTPVYMEWELNAYLKLKQFGLENKNYITISTGIENCNTMKNPKLWDVKKYNQLVALMKKKFPCITIVSIGQNYNFGKIEGVDIDLVGRTTLNDVKVVLKHSILHIGVEGGLVHLNHFLYGTSCCMFGPTSKYFFGYEENININSGIPQQCDNGCEGIIFNWMSYGCFLDKEPICMKTLSAELVFDCISKYLKELPQTDYQIIEVLKREEDIIRKWSAEVSKVSNIAIVNYVENEYMNDILEYGENIIIFERNLKELDKNSYCKKYNVEFEYGNIYNIPVREATYELVINFTIEHEEYPEYALKELLRVLQYSGNLILCCENNNILQKSLAWNGIKIEKLTGYSGQVLMQIQKHNKI